ncbi:MAG: enoyl-CoA hydratase/isomerase family protein [Anaerolineae bacterium]|nr:enoyl-CoA hydratase/isomerase family protein [Anaerolineae bacterium]
MTFDTLLYDVHDHIGMITLNRPDRLNAMTASMLHELQVAFAQARDDAGVRAVVLTGAGRGFCAGADLAAASESMASATTPFSYSQFLQATYNPLVLLMRSLPKPIIAGVNGVAAGAGMSLALACDYRLVVESASFTQAFVKIALVPDSGSTWFLPRLIGTTRALELMLTGRRITAQEALDWGMVNQVVPDGQFSTTLSNLAAQFAAAPTHTVGLIKQAVEFALDSTLEAALAKEAELQDIAGASADHQEGVVAFLQKRPAVFSGQ